MKTIQIKDLVSVGTYPEAGASLYNLAYSDLSNGNEVILDMEDVDSIPTTFMNMSFGRFINEIGKDNTKRLLKFHHITRSQLERIKRYFDLYTQQ